DPFTREEFLVEPLEVTHIRVPIQQPRDLVECRRPSPTAHLEIDAFRIEELRELERHAESSLTDRVSRWGTIKVLPPRSRGKCGGYAAQRKEDATCAARRGPCHRGGGDCPQSPWVWRSSAFSMRQTQGGWGQPPPPTGVLLFAARAGFGNRFLLFLGFDHLCDRQELVALG